jgi:hypothetical protein
MSQLYLAVIGRQYFLEVFCRFFFVVRTPKSGPFITGFFCPERSEGALIATKLQRDRPPKSVKIQIIVLTRDSNSS